jgi:prepilin-type N-terminal cleavage/methylation domain-containing protein
MKVQSQNKGSRKGFTLVELMVAALLIVIIFVAWLRIANFQAIRKESLRRVAIEKAMGYLDYIAGDSQLVTAGTAGYCRVRDGAVYSKEWYPGLNDPYVEPLFRADESIGYLLTVATRVQAGLEHENWPDNGYWAVIALYDKHGVHASEAGRVFFKLSSYMGAPPP